MMPTSSHVSSREESVDADFDLPEGDIIIITAADSDKGGDSDKEEVVEDWDKELAEQDEDGASTLKANMPSFNATSSLSSRLHAITKEIGDVSEDGASTLKMTSILPGSKSNFLHSADDDLESAFALPSDLSRLSLRRPLLHQPSKSSMEWGDHTASSSSATSMTSDAFTSLSFTPGASPSSASTQSHMSSQHDVETDDEQEGDLDGLVLPSKLFESRSGGKELTRILDVKKTLPATVESPSRRTDSIEQDADFEAGLIINDDAVELSPSRLLLGRSQLRQLRPGKTFLRSKSAPSNPGVNISPTFSLPESKGYAQRSLSQVTSIPRVVNRMTTSSPPSQLMGRRSITLDDAVSATPPKATSLRSQKSTSGFRNLTSRNVLPRKASLSSLNDRQNDFGSRPQLTHVLSHIEPHASYNASTAASRARAHQHSLLPRMHSPELHHSSTITQSRGLSPPLTATTQRLTLPVSLGRVRSRPAISSVFDTSVSPPRSPPSTTLTSRATKSLRLATSKPRLPSTAIPAPVVHATTVLRRPKRSRMYGDGTELDAIDDLPTDREKESRFRVVPKPAANRVPGGSYAFTLPAKEIGSETRTLKRKDASYPHRTSEPGKALPVTGTLRKRAQLDLSIPRRKPPPASATPTRRKPTLIRNLSGSSTSKVIGEMTWNPQTLRWEGNEHILREFDAVTASSTRPALITQLTGSSVGSHISGFAAGARIVGNMMFDPVRMCWLSRLPPEEDEPDPFANLGDVEEEDEEVGVGKGGTIRVNRHAVLSQDASTSGKSHSSRSTETPSPSTSHFRSMSETDSETGQRGARPSLIVAEADDAFVEQCECAQRSHLEDVAGWILSGHGHGHDCRQSLYYIRELATKNY